MPEQRQGNYNSMHISRYSIQIGQSKCRLMLEHNMPPTRTCTPSINKPQYSHLVRLLRKENSYTCLASNCLEAIKLIGFQNVLVPEIKNQ